jgi:hypothetical protein
LIEDGDNVRLGAATVAAITCGQYGRLAHRHRNHVSSQVVGP